MDNEYIRETKIIDKTDEEKDLELIISIIKTKRELNLAHKNFEYAQDDLIDYYTYQIKASRAKFDYLVKKAIENQLTVGFISLFLLYLHRYEECIDTITKYSCDISVHCVSLSKGED